MAHAETPPYEGMEPFDAFMLDWDSTNNNEPFGAVHMSWICQSHNWRRF